MWWALAAIIIPNLASASGTARQKRSMGDIRSFATAVMAYQTDNNMYPEEGYLYLISPDYITVLPSADGWGGDFEYHTWWDTDGTQHFQVISRGKDKWPDDSIGDAYQGPPENTSCYARDIVWQDYEFRVKPEGKQRDCK